MICGIYESIMWLYKMSNPSTYDSNFIKCLNHNENPSWLYIKIQLRTFEKSYVTRLSYLIPVRFGVSYFFQPYSYLISPFFDFCAKFLGV